MPQKWAEQLSGNDRNEMMSAVACGWVKKNPEGAAKWALELPSPQDPKQVIPTTLLEPTKQELLKQLEEK